MYGCEHSVNFIIHLCVLRKSSHGIILLYFSCLSLIMSSLSKELVRGKFEVEP